MDGSEPHSPYPPDMSMNDDEEIMRVNIFIICNIHIYLHLEVVQRISN